MLGSNFGPLGWPRNGPIITMLRNQSGPATFPPSHTRPNTPIRCAAVNLSPLPRPHRTSIHEITQCLSSSPLSRRLANLPPCLHPRSFRSTTASVNLWSSTPPVLMSSSLSVHPTRSRRRRRRVIERPKNWCSDARAQTPRVLPLSTSTSKAMALVNWCSGSGRHT